MTAAQLRAALNAAGYADAELRGNRVQIRDREGVKSSREHRRALQQQGIRVLWGGWSIGGDGRAGVYWFNVEREDAK